MFENMLIEVSIPERLLRQFKKRAEEEKAKGNTIEVNKNAPKIVIKNAKGEVRFTKQGKEAQSWISEAPDEGMSLEDFLLAKSQDW